LEHPRTVEDIFVLLSSMPPGTPRVTVLERMGEPQFTDQDVFSWHWREVNIDKTIITTFDGDFVSVMAYFDMPSGNFIDTGEDISALVSERFALFRSELKRLLGISLQEVPGFAVAWYIGEYALVLTKTAGPEGELGFAIIFQRRIH